MSGFAELTERLAALDIDIASVPDDPAIFAERRRVLLDDIASAEAAVASALEALARAPRAAHRQTQEAARAALDALSEAREIRGRDEERVIAAASRKTELAAQAAERFESPPRRRARDGRARARR